MNSQNNQINVIDQKMTRMEKKIEDVNDFLAYMNENDISIDDEKWKVSNELIESIIDYGVKLNIIESEKTNSDNTKSKLSAKNITICEFETILNSIKMLFDGFLTMKADSENLNIQVLELKKENESLKNELSNKKKELTKSRSEITRAKKQIENLKKES